MSTMRGDWRWWAVRGAALVAVVFGAATLASGANVLFGGGAFEARTVAAMSLRTFVWFSIAALALLAWKRA